MFCSGGHKRELEKTSKLHVVTNHFLHSVYEEKKSLNLFQMPALPFRAKAGRSSAGMELILVKMTVHGRLRAVQRGQGHVAC